MRPQRNAAENAAEFGVARVERDASMRPQRNAAENSPLIAMVESGTGGLQ